MSTTGLGQEPFEVMIVSRGRGRGHAVPDMAIAATLTTLLSNVHIQFVSYASGADAYRARGYEVLDLQQPDNPLFLDMVIAFTRMLARAKLDLVVAHEEVPVLPAAKAFEIPCIFITDFFTDPSNLPMRALEYADEILFTAESGLFTEPPYLRGKVHYVGRAVRQMDYTIADRDRARRELCIPCDAMVVLCQPGGWVESVVPLATLLSRAWSLLPSSSKHMIWLAGRDYEALSAQFRPVPSIVTLKDDWKIDRLMAASNVLITKANRLTVYEAAAMGLPSISVSKSLNWPDDVGIASVESNTPILYGSVTPEVLAQLIVEKANARPRPATELSGGITGAVTRIAHHIDLQRRRQPLSRIQEFCHRIA